MSLNGNTISLSNNGGGVTIPADNDWTVSGNNVYVSSGNYVGIGTSSPTQKLDVRGKLNLLYTTGSNNAIIGDGGLGLVSGSDRNIIVGNGAGSLVSGDNNIMIGSETAGDASSNTIAIGHYAKATGDRSVSLGSSEMISVVTEATGNDAVAIGNRAKSSDSAAIAIGLISKATAERAIAIGENTTASGVYGIAIGLSSTASKEGTVAIAHSANASELSAIAIGENSVASDKFAISIGDSAGAEGESSIAIGSDNISSDITEATGDFSIAIGNNALASGNSTTALGRNSNVTATYASALGYATSATFSNSTAIGYNAQTTQANQIMLGHTGLVEVKYHGTLMGPSDKRFKHNVKNDVPGLAFITRLNPVTYNFKTSEFERFNSQDNADRQKRVAQEDYSESEARVRTGFLAQDVAKLCQKLNYDFDGVSTPESEDSQYYSLSYVQFVVPLVQAVKEQQEIIEAQNSKLEEQEKLYKELLDRISALEVSK